MEHTFQLPAAKSGLVVVVGCFNAHHVEIAQQVKAVCLDGHVPIVAFGATEIIESQLQGSGFTFLAPLDAGLGVSRLHLKKLAEVLKHYGDWALFQPTGHMLDGRKLEALKGVIKQAKINTACIGQPLRYAELAGNCWNVNALLTGVTDLRQLGKQGWTHLPYGEVVPPAIPDFTEASVTLLTLFAGRTNLFPTWLAKLHRMDLPKTTELHLVYNSAQRDLLLKIEDSGLLANTRFRRITLTHNNRFVDAGGVYHDRDKHQNIGNMYNEAFSSIQTDYVLAWEDDVFPHNEQAARRLWYALHTLDNASAVAAVYRSGNTPSICCFAKSMDSWHGCVKYAELTREVLKVGFSGAGFTLYRTEQVKAALPTISCQLEGRPAGWDAFLSKRLRDLGGNIYVHCDVRADHYAGGTKEYILPN